MSEKFKGFPKPEQNYSKLPHVVIDQLPNIQSVSELKCVLYILRHTWGYSEFDKPKSITTDEFMSGRKRKDGSRIDGGTGLSNKSVIQGLRDAEEHGYIISNPETSPSGRISKGYRLNMSYVDSTQEADDTCEDSTQQNALSYVESPDFEGTERNSFRKKEKDLLAPTERVPAAPEKEPTKEERISGDEIVDPVDEPKSPEKEQTGLNTFNGTSGVKGVIEEEGKKARKKKSNFIRFVKSKCYRSSLSKEDEKRLDDTFSARYDENPSYVEFTERNSLTWRDVNKDGSVFKYPGSTITDLIFQSESEWERIQKLYEQPSVPDDYFISMNNGLIEF